MDSNEALFLRDTNEEILEYVKECSDWDIKPTKNGYISWLIKDIYPETKVGTLGEELIINMRKGV